MLPLLQLGVTSIPSVGITAIPQLPDYGESVDDPLDCKSELENFKPWLDQVYDQLIHPIGENQSKEVSDEDIEDARVACIELESSYREGRLSISEYMLQWRHKMSEKKLTKALRRLFTPDLSLIVFSPKLQEAASIGLIKRIGLAGRRKHVRPEDVREPSPSVPKTGNDDAIRLAKLFEHILRGKGPSMINLNDDAKPGIMTWISYTQRCGNGSFAVFAPSFMKQDTKYLSSLLLLGMMDKRKVPAALGGCHKLATHFNSINYDPIFDQLLKSAPTEETVSESKQ
jgi:hypothetical protein